jgi:hypothetical protein
MSLYPRDAAGGPFVVTLVVDMPVTKLEALEVVAFVADAAVEHAGTAYPRVPLGPNAWAEVQIPKFADPPPIAIDVCSDASEERARVQAERLAAGLARVGWQVRPPRDYEV